jgi:hypothetical protein
MQEQRADGTGADRVPGSPSRAAVAPERPVSGAVVTALLMTWQTERHDDVFERLVGAVVPQATVVARGVLRQCGVHDPAAIDDALALVLDHLRRLPGPAAGERAVAPFVPADDASQRGVAFLHRLATDRARDVARAQRRRGRRCRCVPRVEAVADVAAADGAAAHGAEDARARVTAALELLPRRDRAVVTLLLTGHNQAAIARALGVCEGSVSRIRGRAIVRLQALVNR